MSRRIESWIARAVLVTTLLTILLTTAVRFGPLVHGLRADYFRNSSFMPPAAISVIDSTVSMEHLADAGGGSAPEIFAVRWAGAIAALRAGTYMFETTSDGASRVFIDGAPVLDTGGGEARVTGTIALAGGAHNIVVEDVHDRDRPHLQASGAHRRVRGARHRDDRSRRRSSQHRGRVRARSRSSAFPAIVVSRRVAARSGARLGPATAQSKKLCGIDRGRVGLSGARIGRMDLGD